MKKQIENAEMVTRLRGMASQILSPGSEGKRFFEAVANELEDLRKALDTRNEIEGKAHALFTEPIDGHGQTFAHSPEQCDPLGFVTVLRAALRKLLNGESLANPFIYIPK